MSAAAAAYPRTAARGARAARGAAARRDCVNALGASMVVGSGDVCMGSVRLAVGGEEGCVSWTDGRFEVAELLRPGRVSVSPLRWPRDYSWDWNLRFVTFLNAEVYG